MWKRPIPNRYAVPLMIFLVMVIAAFVPLLVWRPDPIDRRPWIDDQVNLRNMVALLLAHYDPVPLADDGRVDVYRLVSDGIVNMDDAQKFFRGHRAGTGPSAEEIRTGNYSRFAFVRRKGPALPNQPLLWDAEQDRRTGWRLVAFANGAVMRLDADEWAAFRSP